MKVEFYPVAKNDLLEIALYIAQNNPLRALSFVDELETQCLRLGQAGGIGAPRPELGEGVRMLPHGRYLIFYHEHASMIRIECFMHGTRDIGSDDFDVDGQPMRLSAALIAASDIGLGAVRAPGKTYLPSPVRPRSESPAVQGGGIGLLDAIAPLGFIKIKVRPFRFTQFAESDKQQGIRYFMRQYFEPFARTSRYNPPPSTSL